MLPPIFIYTITFIFGIVIGSFLNVCIYRIPEKEDIVKESSHCLNCGHKLAWYDLFPLVSFILLGGRCRYCKTKLSIQYPTIEALNGVMYVLIVYLNGANVESLLYGALVSALIVLSVIDFRTYEIPLGINIFILIIGIINTILDTLKDKNNLLEHLIGMIAVSGFLAIIYYITKGRGIGGGDVKLMATCGLFIGWKLIILAFLLGCILGSVIHIIRMKISKADHVLAMGPYLSAGVVIALLWGNSIINWYVSFYK